MGYFQNKYDSLVVKNKEVKELKQLVSNEITILMFKK